MHLPMMVALKDIGEDVCFKVPFLQGALVGCIFDWYMVW